MPRKVHQLQVRVTVEEKEAIRRRARQAGLDVSAYVLARVLPPASARWRELLEELRGAERPGFTLAALNDFLAALGPVELPEAVADAELDDLPAWLQNYVAAMVEHACHLREVPPPSWVRLVEPLEQPYFAAPLAGLRPHLLRRSPVAFKRRNLFVDSTVGDRV